MKTIGLLGGMSWESTAVYYRIINETVCQRLGALHSAPLVLYSVDFEPIHHLQHAGKWSETADLLGRAAKCIEAAGADCLVICTNTMHKVADQVQQRIHIPMLHIADATAAAIKHAGMDTVGLLGTRFTMEQDFYRSRLTDQHGLNVLIPDDAEREIVHRVIYDELCVGDVRPSSRDQFVAIIDRMVAKGAAGIILGCTEISSLIRPEDTSAPLFDTTQIHAEAAVDWALAGNS